MTQEIQKPKNVMQFFVLRVASNKEDQVREKLLRKVKIEALEEKVGRILVPTERVRSIKAGVRKESDRKLYPGYVFIELDLDKNGMIPEDVWFMIKETEGVGDFIGSNGKPTPMAPKDASKMVEEAERPEEAPSLRTEYKKGDKIKVTNGAFINFEGNVDEIIPDKGMVRIITTIFGRPTPLELEYWQIEKI
ncbi:MAG TPA: transcription termination/antitermination protein NusG [Tepidisphaeraceae bacterium]|jgi:transcriptional antiterminator NusG